MKALCIGRRYRLLPWGMGISTQQPRRSRDSRAGRESRRLGGVRRAFRLLTGHARKERIQLGGVHRPRRPHPGPDPEFYELT